MPDNLSGASHTCNDVNPTPVEECPACLAEGCTDHMGDQCPHCAFVNGTPTQADPYTSEPTHLRIYREETGDEYVWHVDGADNEGRYTEDVRTFTTFAECVTSADLFVADTTYDGVTWKWDTTRKTTLRRTV